MSNSSDDHSKDKMNDEQWGKDIAGLEESSKLDDVSKKFNEIKNHANENKEELHKDVRKNSDDINLLKADVAQRRWLSPDKIISIGLTLIGLWIATLSVGIGAFYHLNSRTDRLDDSLGGRVDSLSGQVNEIHQLLHSDIKPISQPKILE